MSSPFPRAQTSKSMHRVHSSMSNYKNSLVYSEGRRPCITHVRIKSQNILPDENPEATAVEALEFWDYKYDSEIQKQLIQAKDELTRKLNHQDIVEENLNKRKAHSKSTSSLDQTKEVSRFYKAYEDTLMNTYQDLECKFHETIKNRENLRKKTCEIKEEIKNFSLSMEKLDNAYGSALQKYQNFGHISKSQKDIAQYLNAKQQHKENLFKQKIEAQQHIEMLQIDISHLSRELTELDANTSKMRNELKVVRKELIGHYSSLLKKGDDSRNQGLSWIVKLFLKLKHEVRKEMFPACLDDKSIDVIMKIARKSLELDEFYDKLAETKAPKMMKYMEKPSIKMRLHKLKQNVRIRKPTYFKKKLSWAPSELLGNGDEAVWNYNRIQDTMRLEENIKTTHQEMIDLQTAEVKRMTKESLRTGYNIRNMIGYIVGVENVDKFMIISMKEIKEIQAVRESTSTFTFMAKFLPKNYSKSPPNH
ncbi:hypothetical protein SteCoe_2369 [Stentor coeruleus]|uniref:DUF4200 domain-containing protein n=1 Tax=Stentor coeruleus TaxID=5963 RepID=A0A1R2CZP4_9CILI|nr:hypothetical protein SteCoe_2369 [Stentor coeruleus]